MESWVIVSNYIAPLLNIPQCFYMFSSSSVQTEVQAAQRGVSRKFIMKEKNKLIF